MHVAHHLSELWSNLEINLLHRLMQCCNILFNFTLSVDYCHYRFGTAIFV